MPDRRDSLADGVDRPIVVGKDSQSARPDIFDLPRCQMENHWQRSNEITGTFANGKYRHDDDGMRLFWMLTIPTAYRETVAMLRDLVTWKRRHPNGRLWLWRHRDDIKDRVEVVVVGEYADLFDDQMAYAHKIYTITFVQVDATDTLPVGGPSTFSSFCQAGLAYPDDQTADCFASVGGPWDWGEFRPGDSPNWFTATVGAFTLEILYASGYTYHELVMRLSAGTRVRYKGEQVKDSTIESSIYGNTPGGDPLAGLFYRYIDATHYYLLTADTSAHTITLSLVNGGAPVPLQTFSAVGIKPESWFDLRCVFSGGTHVVYWRPRQMNPLLSPYDWQYAGTVADLTITDAGYGGMHAGAGTDPSFKNFDLKNSDYLATDLGRVGHFSPYQKPFDIPW